MGPHQVLWACQRSWLVEIRRCWPFLLLTKMDLTEFRSLTLRGNRFGWFGRLGRRGVGILDGQPRSGHSSMPHSTTR